MKGLLIKDFLVIAKQLKLFLLLIPIMALTAGTSLASIAILLGAVLPMTAVAYDEQSKWEQLAAMMPYSKKDLVLSKYLLGYLCMAGATILFLLAQFVLTIVTAGNTDSSFFMILLSIVNGLLLIAVNMPILFKFGAQKGRFVFILFLGLGCAAASIFNHVNAEVPVYGAKFLPAIVLILAILANIVSVMISMRLKKA